MKLFGNRYKKLSDEVSKIRRELGEKETVSIWDWPMLGNPFRFQPNTVLDRLDALEEENRLLREYLKIEAHTVKARKTYRKKASSGH